MSKTTAIYARYSSHAQDGGTSIEVQLDACRSAIGKTAKTAEYIDRARTGRAVAGREAFTKLLDDARQGRIEKLIVHKYDRLGRSLAETASIVAELEDSGIQVMSVTEGQDSLVRGVHLAVAEWYSKVLAERVSAGLKQRFKEKCFTGGPMTFGYRVVVSDGCKRLAIDEEQAKVVRWIFKEFLSESIGAKEIARRLNQRGIKSKRRGTWTWTSIKNILHHELYVGEVIANRFTSRLNKQTGKRVFGQNNPSEWERYHDENLRIISDEDFKAVKIQLAERAKAMNRYFVRHELRIFTGLLFCGECGSLMYRKKNTFKGVTYIYYQCGEHHRNGTLNCNSNMWVREDKLLKDITANLMAIFDDSNGLIEDAVEEAKRQLASGKEDFCRIRGEIEEVDKTIAKLTQLITDDDIEQAAKRALSRQLAELEARREVLQQNIKDAAEDTQQNAENLVKTVEQAIKEARECLTNVATPDQLNNLLRRLVGEMMVNSDGTISPRQKLPTSNQTDRFYGLR